MVSRCLPGSVRRHRSSLAGRPRLRSTESQSALETSQVQSASPLSLVAALGRLYPPRRASPCGAEFTLLGSCVPLRELHSFPSQLTPAPDDPRCSRGAPSQNVAADSCSPEAAAILDLPRDEIKIVSLGSQFQPWRLRVGFPKSQGNQQYIPCLNPV
ncbi:hypothetical protein NDU88_006250 [Pleurodeles waltl]|uniref:Uncharacterized protein n=1 Tax=Pleurodeles waltl TaxID=8319 RepID=A0AAV7SP25_PLEWA|nr:hypothetical protein NDU88_006250 [Pleurodeles waltl]